MDVKCEVCQYKDQEILFLRDTIKVLIEQKKIQEATYAPVYINDMGEAIKGDETQVVDE